MVLEKKIICGYFQGKTWTKLMSSEKKREDEEGKKNSPWISMDASWVIVLHTFSWLSPPAEDIPENDFTIFHDDKLTMIWWDYFGKLCLWHHFSILGKLWLMQRSFRFRISGTTKWKWTTLPMNFIFSLSCLVEKTETGKNFGQTKSFLSILWFQGYQIK